VNFERLMPIYNQEAACQPAGRSRLSGVVDIRCGNLFWLTR